MLLRHKMQAGREKPQAVNTVQDSFCASWWYQALRCFLQRAVLEKVWHVGQYHLRIFARVKLGNPFDNFLKVLITSNLLK